MGFLEEWVERRVAARKAAGAPEVPVVPEPAPETPQAASEPA